MPFPPPPAEAFTRTGYPIACARLAISRSSRPSAPNPGTTGTPAAAMIRFASILLPIRRMASGGGPMKTTPACAQASAKSAFSARKP